ncbi:hypothetical protein EIN_323580 [Entamoeba invadens IP1]|uniref:Uncharacterized protein n=1 Tax=Entamoeba invadens IP1 TaxID=370355 RepID=L7FNY9_ENTIV|nr:hypothetical protein EIN_323580 [Entamoeba invadens IP1]ELP89315.1 hypothetical protein EIN_323580 [Entamoeba invadens IP1]|eukprot:XP_004256086.1 hypothetical protein EIN_323580 [Entamoeba invadens IP1]
MDARVGKMLGWPKKQNHVTTHYIKNITLENSREYSTTKITEKIAIDQMCHDLVANLLKRTSVVVRNHPDVTKKTSQQITKLKFNYKERLMIPQSIDQLYGLNCLLITAFEVGEATFLDWYPDCSC